MEWDLIKSQQGVSIGKITNRGAFLVGSSRDIIGLLPGLVRHEYPRGETPKQANLFINRFMTVKGDFLPSEFRVMRWVHSTQKIWWTRMMSYVIEQLRETLLQFGMYPKVMAVQYGIPQSHYHFFAMMELYNPDTCTFFTLSEELGFSFHKIYEVSRLPMKETPYEEYIPGKRSFMF